MNFVISIPKGKNILEFFQEMNGGQGLLKDVWHFIHRDVVEELMRQAAPKELSPDVTLPRRDFSFALHYGSSAHHIGAIALCSIPCHDITGHLPLWFFVANLYLFEDSPIQIAFQQPSSIPSGAICLVLEK